MPNHDLADDHGLYGGTLVATDDGDIPVGWLRPGDRVLTRDNGYCALDRMTRTAQPSASVMIAPDNLGPGLPKCAVRLRAAHGVLLSSDLFDLHFGALEMLAAAADLPSVLVAPQDTDLPFYQMGFADHQIILADGLWVETMMPSRATGTGSPPLAARPRLQAWQIRMFDIAKVLAVESEAA